MPNPPGATEKPILELRQYFAVPGRASDLVRRFEEHTFALFEAYGIEVLTFGQEIADPNRIYYVVAWESEEQMKSTWDTFREDPRWKRIAQESEADGPLAERYDHRVLRAVSPRGQGAGSA
jgi:hypothetical protein